MKFSKIKLFSLLAAVMMVFGNGSAFASDDKLYSGGECHIGHYSDFPNAIWHIYSGSFINYGNTYIRVSCPIIKDSTTKRIKSGWISMIDENASYNVKCTIVSRPSTSNSAGIIVNRYSSGKSSTPQIKTFGGINYYTNGNYSMECTLPRASGSYPYQTGIMAYRVNEDT